MTVGKCERISRYAEKSVSTHFNNWIFSFLKTCPLTLSEHLWTTLVSSEMTISTHFNDGVFSFSICFLTTASKAISGVNKPVLKNSK